MFANDTTAMIAAYICVFGGVAGYYVHLLLRSRKIEGEFQKLEGKKSS